MNYKARMIAARMDVIESSLAFEPPSKPNQIISAHRTTLQFKVKAAPGVIEALELLHTLIFIVSAVGYGIIVSIPVVDGI